MNKPNRNAFIRDLALPPAVFGPPPFLAAAFLSFFVELIGAVVLSFMI